MVSPGSRWEVWESEILPAYSSFYFKSWDVTLHYDDFALSCVLRILHPALLVLSCGLGLCGKHERKLISFKFVLFESWFLTLSIFVNAMNGLGEKRE